MTTSHRQYFSYYMLCNDMETCLALEMPPFLLTSLKLYMFKGIILIYLEDSVIQLSLFYNCVSQMNYSVF